MTQANQLTLWFQHSALQQLHFLVDINFWANVAVVVLATLVIYLVTRRLIHLISHQLIRAQSAQHHLIYEIIAVITARTNRLLIALFALLIGLKLVALPSQWQSNLTHGWFLIVVLQAGLWCDSTLKLWQRYLRERPQADRNPVTTTIIGISLRTLVWVLALLLVLANLGVNITALVASLGVGGIAVALAVQTVLSDMFASLSIGFDKPFEIGDFVVFNNVSGTIEHIGLKTTRLRSLSGEQVICSNTILLGQMIHNYKRMSERRILFQFGVTYDTDAQTMRELPQLTQRIIESIAGTRFDRAHFVRFDSYQLTIEAVYYVLSPEYIDYMNIQQEINLQLLAELNQREINFAFPTQTIEFAGGQLPPLQVERPTMTRNH